MSKVYRYFFLLAGLSVFTGSSVWSHSDVAPRVDQGELTNIYIQGTYHPEFEPPAPGTYELPVIHTAKDHKVLDNSGNKVGLFESKKGKVAVLSFIYTSCTDPTGCPLSSGVLQRVDQILAKNPELADKVTLMTMSFDPERDNPKRMKKWEDKMVPKTDWKFFTSEDPEQLQIILDDFNQQVDKLYNQDGKWSGLFRHVLKVFLLDEENNIRNIYSVGLFSPQLVMNDVETVLIGSQ